MPAVNSMNKARLCFEAACMFQVGCSGIPEQYDCLDLVRASEKTETVNGKGCRKSVRMETHGTSGRNNRRPRRGNNPELPSVWQLNGRPETPNNALGLEAEKSAYNGSNRLC